MRMQWTQKAKKATHPDEQMARQALLGDLSEDVLAQISGGLSVKGACHTVKGFSAL